MAPRGGTAPPCLAADRSQRRAIVLFAVIVTLVIWFSESSGKPVAALQGVVIALMFSFVLFRFGLVPFIVGFFFELIFSNFPATFDGSLWYSGASFLAFAVILGLTAFGLYAALAGRSAFGSELGRPG